ncbi:helix-turn-helix domain-containing protein [Acinetobacter baumannii]
MPCSTVFEKIADKWVLLILNILEHETQHFNLLKKILKGFTQSLVSEVKNVRERRFYRTKNSDIYPIRVDYSLTPLGQNVAAMAYQLKEWAETNIEQVLAAQIMYDEKY